MIARFSQQELQWILQQHEPPPEEAKGKVAFKCPLGIVFGLYIYILYILYIYYIYIIYIEVGCGIGMLDYHSTYHILFACREYLHTCPVECGRCSTPNVGK